MDIQDVYLVIAGYFESINGQLNILLCTVKKKYTLGNHKCI